MSKCEEESCKKEVKELFEVTKFQGTVWLCKECASDQDSRVVRKSDRAKITKTTSKSGRYGGTSG